MDEATDQHLLSHAHLRGIYIHPCMNALTSRLWIRQGEEDAYRGIPFEERFSELAGSYV
jgi:hypothetical protein